MNKNRYVIDTSSLIDLSRQYPRDIFPRVWEQLERLVKESRIVSPREVLDEVESKDDPLSIWSKDHKMVFKEVTVTQIDTVRDIMHRYPGLVGRMGRFSADPWVIALAVECRDDPQKTLEPISWSVVTEEQIRGNRVRIPFVCKEMGIPCINFLGLIRKEGWSF